MFRRAAAAVFLDSSRILNVAKPVQRFNAIQRLSAVYRPYSSKVTPGYVGFKVSSVEDSVKIDVDFKEDHFVLDYHASDKNVKVSKDFPYVWLRDRCRCASCFNQKTQENEITPFVLTPLDMAPVDVSMDQNGSGVSSTTVNVTCKYCFPLVDHKPVEMKVFLGVQKGRMSTSQPMILKNLPKQDLLQKYAKRCLKKTRQFCGTTENLWKLPTDFRRSTTQPTCPIPLCWTKHSSLFSNTGPSSSRTWVGLYSILDGGVWLIWLFGQGARYRRRDRERGRPNRTHTKVAIWAWILCGPFKSGVYRSSLHIGQFNASHGQHLHEKHGRSRSIPRHWAGA